ncbi:MAG TPA: putative peptidoglycan glycosyltransferase FtsW [Longilinea sp.]|nr:putative peptidoglycan glycosyltransferase FtsW [Longilinea sp.]
MGETTAVNTINHAIRQSKTIKSLRLGLDVPLLLVVVTLMAFGLLMVYSASWGASLEIGDNPAFFFTNQIRWAFLGSLVMIGLSLFDYHRLQKLVVPMMLVTLIMLVLVLTSGETRLNARRALFGGSVQPSELAKLTIIIYLSFWLYAKREVLNNISFGLLPMAGILGVTGGIIILQPDLSAVLTIVIMGALMFFLAGVDWKQVLIIIVVAVALAWLLVTVMPTGKARLDPYLAGLRDPVEASYHVQRSLESVVRGGIFGVGIGRGATKFTGLPVAHTDSIFAVIAEETGLLGATGIIILYLIILWRGLTIASRAPDMLGKLLAAGCTLWILLEASINMGVMVNLLPFAGNALPFISAGGSSLVMCLAAIGLILSVARISNRESDSKQRRSFSAVVDMRRRNGRRSVSRPGRVAIPRE